MTYKLELEADVVFNEHGRASRVLQVGDLGLVTQTDADGHLILRTFDRFIDLSNPGNELTEYLGDLWVRRISSGVMRLVVTPG